MPQPLPAVPASENASPQDPADAAGAQKHTPGHVEFDSRGNSVWRWNVEQGDSTSVLLKSLEIDDLELEPTRSARAPRGEMPSRLPNKPAAGKPKPGNAEKVRKGKNTLEAEEPPRIEGAGGFDPYNRS
ncbi:MAG TPA: hypothetical protein VFV10_00655 [Gammaproteobacteria bacterium]|nr:hypothetical protein [Gammaproteobacteria bacterium]